MVEVKNNNRKVGENKLFNFMDKGLDILRMNDTKLVFFFKCDQFMILSLKTLTRKQSNKHFYLQVQ